MYEKKAACGNCRLPGQKPAQICSASAPNRWMMPAFGGGSTGRPENLLLARSKVPQKKWTGDILPRNRERWSLRTRSACDRTLKKRFAQSGSYVEWTVSSANGIGSLTSEGLGTNRVAMPRPLRLDMKSA